MIQNESADKTGKPHNELPSASAVDDRAGAAS